MSDSRRDRAFTRIPVHIQAEVRPEGHDPIAGVVHDLSFNGVSVDAPGATLSPGTECEVELILDGGADQIRLPAHARVVRSSDQGFALVFTALDGDIYEHFERVLLYNAPDPARVEAELHDHPEAQPPLRDPAGQG